MNIERTFQIESGSITPGEIVELSYTGKLGKGEYTIKSQSKHQLSNTKDYWELYSYPINATKAIVVYEWFNEEYDPFDYIGILEINPDKTTTIINPIQFSIKLQDCQIINLEENKFLFTYSEGLAKALVLTINEDNTITLNSPTTFGNVVTNHVSYISLVKLANNKIFCAYRNGISNTTKLPECIVFNITGNVVTISTSVPTFGTLDTRDIKSLLLSYDGSTYKVLTTYQDVKSSCTGRAVVWNISNTDTITKTDSIFHSTIGWRNANIIKLNSNKVLITYGLNQNNSGAVGTPVWTRIGILTISGANAVTLSNITDVTTSTSAGMKLCQLSNEYTLAYMPFKIALLKTNPDTTYNLGAWIDIHPTNIDYINIMNMPGGPVLILASDTKNYFPFSWVVELGSSNKKLGIATNSTGKVLLYGIYNGYSGLTPSAIYYCQSDNTIGMNITDTKVGIALSPTELWVNHFIIK